MRADAERWASTSAADGVGRRRRIGEQARAGDDASVVGVENAVVDARGQAKVVGVDDKTSSHDRVPGRWKTWAVSASPAWNSRHGASRCRSCSTKPAVTRTPGREPMCRVANLGQPNSRSLWLAAGMGPTQLVEDVLAIPGHLIFDAQQLREVQLNALHPYATDVAAGLERVLDHFGYP